MNMKKITAACATAAALAALCVPGAAFAADGTLTLNAGDGSTLAGHSFTGIGWTMLDMKRRRMDVTARHGRR